MDALTYFIFWAALILIMMRFGCGSHVLGHGQHGSGKKSGHSRDAGDVRWVPPDTDTDPVCGMKVQTKNAKPSVHNGMVYYFCSRECRERFEAAPDLYIPNLTSGQFEPMEDSHG